jgi:predicted P-loop ATPase
MTTTIDQTKTSEILATIPTLDPIEVQGLAALSAALAELKPVDDSQELWLKYGHDRFVVADTFDPTGPCWETKGNGTERVRTTQHPNRYEFLVSKQKEHGGGVFLLHSQPQGYPLKEYVMASDNICVELDNGTSQEQWEKLSEFVYLSGLEPRKILTSGGKSYHAHWQGTEHFPIEPTVYLRRLMAIALMSDPAACNPHQPMRVEGFDRHENGTLKGHQTRVYQSDNCYTDAEMVAGLKRYFAAKGIPFPDAITDEWWSVLKRPLKANDLDGLKAELSKGLTGYKAEKQAKAEKAEKALQERLKQWGNQPVTDGLGKTVSECVEQAKHRLGTSLYEKYGHEVGDRRFCCPWHPSQSKNSAWVSPATDGTPLFHCPTCTSEKGVNSFQFFLMESKGSFEIPKGKEYVELARDYCQLAGIELPTFKPRKDKSEDKKNGDQTKAKDKDKSSSLITFEKLQSMDLRWNELLMQIEDREGNEIDTDELWHDFRLEGSSTGIQEFVIAAKKAAKVNAYHPVEQYLESVADLAPIDIRNLSRRYFGTLNPIYDEMLYRHLIASVARVFNPGCKKDEVLVLQGKQGILKSTFWSTLYGEFFTDAPFTGDRDDLLVQHRYWARELAELEHITGRKQAGEMKAFLSRSEDTFREPYGRCTKTYKRGSVFVGSVNPKTFLFDDTGNRRFWVIPVEVEKINVDTLARERDAIWAAAVHAYRAGEKTYLSHEHSQQINDLNENFRQEDSWLATVRNFLEYRTETTVSEILTDCLHFELFKITKRDEMRVSVLLGELEWKRGGRKCKDGKMIRFWTKDQPTSANPSEVGRGVGQLETFINQGFNQPDQPNQPISETFCAQDQDLPMEHNPQIDLPIELLGGFVEKKVGQVGSSANIELETLVNQEFQGWPTSGQPHGQPQANPPSNCQQSETTRQIDYPQTDESFHPQAEQNQIIKKLKKAKTPEDIESIQKTWRLDSVVWVWNNLLTDPEKSEIIAMSGILPRFADDGVQDK